MSTYQFVTVSNYYTVNPADFEEGIYFYNASSSDYFEQVFRLMLLL
jgi:hypothetical protein